MQSTEDTPALCNDVLNYSGKDKTVYFILNNLNIIGHQKAVYELFYKFQSNFLFINNLKLFNVII